MRIALFYHSLISDWNHGNAHFLRGIASELQACGHVVEVYEPSDSWSLQNLVGEHGEQVIDEFRRHFPHLHVNCYDTATLDLDYALDQIDLVIVHEWNPPKLVAQIGKHRAKTRRYKLLFHDTHHRMVTDPHSISRFDLTNYDGVLAFGKVLADLYLEKGISERSWTWHEAADVRLFKPLENFDNAKHGDLVWIGNWGDEERSRELVDFLIDPCRELGINAHVFGVRYPESARALLSGSGIRNNGWIPNYRVPEVFSAFRVTVHIPRRPYTEALPGIPTIRVFEALACGIPLICTPWQDVEGLFTAEKDYLTAQTPEEMRTLLRTVLNEPDVARSISKHGLKTILQRHTCSHRAEELLNIYQDLCNPNEGNKSV